jgi:hypothetical protein
MVSRHPWILVGVRNPGFTVPLNLRNPGFMVLWFYGFMVPLDLRTLRILLAPLVLRGSPSLPLLLQVEEGEGGGFSGVPGVPAVSEGGFRMFVAGRMVLRLFLESHGTLVAVSAPLVMPLRDSDIPMNVPFTFP